MIVCQDPQKLVFINVPHTGSNPITGILKAQYNGKLIGANISIIPARWAKYYTFVVTRNPYERACFIYELMCKREDDKYGIKEYLKKAKIDNVLEGFLRQIYRNELPTPQLRLQTSPQYVFHDNNFFDEILSFESLQNDFNKLPFVTESVELSTKGCDHWEGLLTPKAGKFINKIYERDFQLFDYKMRNY